MTSKKVGATVCISVHLMLKVIRYQGLSTTKMAIRKC